MKAYLVHGWDGSPGNCWFPWLKSELEKEGYEVYALAMPDPEEPKIDAWVGKLKGSIEPDEETIFVGHSIGCQTILRYLEGLDNSIKIKGVFFVAGFVNLKGLETEEEKELAEPWLRTPIDWGRVKIHSDNFVAFFSDNDTFVYVSDGDIFKEKLGAKIIIEDNKGHFDDSHGVKEIPGLLREIKSL